MSKTLKFALFSVILAALAACGSNDFYSEGYAATETDEAILATIQRGFWEDPGIDEEDLIIRVDHTDVWVSGRVSNSEEKSRILANLRAVDGIGQINIEGLTRR